MRAKPGDAVVCPICNGCGTRLFKINGITFGAKCNARVDTAQAELPVEESAGNVTELQETSGVAVAAQMRTPSPRIETGR